MRKSNYAVLAIAAVVAALLLALWYYLGFNSIDNPLDLGIAIVWWVAIVAVAVIISRVEQRRRRQIRTMYLSPNALYNSERGMVGFGDATAVETMQQVLEELKYGFDTKDVPDEKKFKFEYVVQTDEYKADSSESAKATQDAARGAADGAEHADATAEVKVAESAESVSATEAEAAQKPSEETTWKGTVIKIDRENGNTETKFESLEELKAALAA